MGEKTILEVARRLGEGQRIENVRDVPQTVFLADEGDIPGGISADDIVLHSHEECLRNKPSLSFRAGACRVAQADPSRYPRSSRHVLWSRRDRA